MRQGAFDIDYSHFKTMKLLLTTTVLGIKSGAYVDQISDVLVAYDTISYHTLQFDYSISDIREDVYRIYGITPDYNRLQQYITG